MQQVRLAIWDGYLRRFLAEGTQVARMIGKLSLLLVCVAVASGNPAAGKPWHWKSPKPLVDPRIHVNATPRIVGGVEATPHSWPHQAALFIDDMYFCGGSLISSEWVLTAAHCMDGAGFVEVVLGAHNIRQNEASQVSITSTDFFTHENWNSWLLTNDIALIRLPSPVSLNSNIKTVKLPSSDVSVGTTVTPTGWGRPSDCKFQLRHPPCPTRLPCVPFVNIHRLPPLCPTAASGISDVLRQVNVPVMTNNDCDSVYGIVGDGVVCIDGTGGKSTCNGDSGGPLNLNGMTYGITSFGSSAGCEKGYPAAFTRVYYYLDWIQQKTGVTP
ncbi:chymotrypsin BI-like isoform X1 [Penaeus vannamei]|uniref:chymotrypsin BI-like isoform X1 n=1 Tax=Penaeus vannamei TaxID=6689 RepID=UPI00387F8233